MGTVEVTFNLLWVPKWKVRAALFFSFKKDFLNQISARHFYSKIGQMQGNLVVLCFPSVAIMMLC